jgi:3-phenylpropionate/trans-cinnamate dioxygenase ferredoxin subunit
MGNYILACNRVDIPVNGMVSIKLEANEILLANVAGNIYAIQNRCPHMGGDLSKGVLTGQVVTCPVHGSQFDVTTGKMIRWMRGSGTIYSIGKLFKQPLDAVAYNVKIDGQQVFVEVT